MHGANPLRASYLIATMEVTKGLKEDCGLIKNICHFDRKPKAVQRSKQKEAEAEKSQT